MCLLVVSEVFLDRGREGLTDAGYAGTEDNGSNPCKAHDGVEGPIVAALRGSDAKQGHRNTAFDDCSADGVEVFCDIKDLQESVPPLEPMARE